MSKEKLDQTCNYTARKNDPSNWYGENSEDWVLDAPKSDGGLETEVWNCPHPKLSTDDEEESAHCVFHADPDIVPDEIDIGAKIENAIENAEIDNSQSEHRAQFIGAKFGCFDISNTTISTDHVSDIRFNHAIFNNKGKDISFENTIFKTEDSDDLISFAGAGFVPEDAHITFENTEMHPKQGQILFTDVDVIPEAQAESLGGVTFEGIRCEPTDGGKVAFTGTFDTVGIAEISFESSQLRPRGYDGGVVYFSGEFTPDSSAVLPDEVPIRFDDAIIEPKQNGSVEFTNLKFKPKSKSGISFKNVRFGPEEAGGDPEGQCLFKNVTFSPKDRAYISFADAKFHTIDIDATFRPQDNGLVSFAGATFDPTGIPRVRFDSQFVPEDNGKVTFKNAIFRSGRSPTYVRFSSKFKPTGEHATISFEGARFVPESVNVVDNGRAGLAEPSSTSISFSNSEFCPKAGSVSFTDAVFAPGEGGEVQFSDSQFLPENGGRVLFTEAEFRPTINGKVTFEDAALKPDQQARISFSQAQFRPVDESSISFEEITAICRNEGEISFEMAEIEARDTATISFDDAKLVTEQNGTLTFENATIRSDVSFAFSACHGNVRFDGIAVSATLTFSEEETFDTHVAFPEADFSAATLENFDPVPGMNFQKTDFTEIDLAGVTFRGSNAEQAVFSRANLYGVDFTDARIGGALFGDALVNHKTDFGNLRDEQNTEFPQFAADYEHDLRVAYDRENTRKYGFVSRFAFALNKYRLAVLNWNRDPVSARLNESSSSRDGRNDNGYEGSSGSMKDELQTAAGVYRTIESVAQDNALTNLHSQAFYRRQEMNRKQYAVEAKEALAQSQSEGNGQLKQLKAVRKWMFATISRFGFKYGESFGRIISVSFLIILAFSLVYPVGGWIKPRDGDRIFYSHIINDPMLFFDTFYFSTLTFTTLGMGDYEPVGLGQLLTTLNTALGAIMIALVVFVLGRRATR